MIKFLLSTLATLALLSSASTHVASGKQTTKRAKGTDHSQNESVAGPKPTQGKSVSAPRHSREKTYRGKPSSKDVVDGQKKKGSSSAGKPTPKIVVSTKHRQDKREEVNTKPIQESTNLSQDSNTSNSSSTSFDSPTTFTSSTMGSCEEEKQGKEKAGKKPVEENPFVKGAYERLATDFILTYPFLLDSEFWETKVTARRVTKEGGAREVNIKLFHVDKLKSAYPDGIESLKLDNLQLAIKHVKMEDDEGKRGIQREYEVLKYLNHPNIVRCYGIHNNDETSTVSLIMEGSAYGSIEKLAKNKSAGLTVKLRKKLIWEVYTAMKYMHSLGIVHRDIKMENLIIMSDGMVRVIDFGLACVLPNYDGCIAQANNPANVAPEAYVQGPFLTIAADLWSFGVLLVEMLGTSGHLRGFHPHADESHKDNVYWTIYDAKDSRYLPGVVGATSVVNSLLKRNPQARLKAVDEAAIEDLLLTHDDSNVDKVEDFDSREYSPSASTVRKPYDPYKQQQMDNPQPTQLDNSFYMQSRYDGNYSNEFSSNYNGSEVTFSTLNFNSSSSQPSGNQSNYPSQFSTNQNGFEVTFSSAGRSKHFGSHSNSHFSTNQQGSEVTYSNSIGQKYMQDSSLPHYQKQQLTQHLPPLIFPKQHTQHQKQAYHRSMNNSKKSQDYYHYQQHQQYQPQDMPEFYYRQEQYQPRSMNQHPQAQQVSFSSSQYQPSHAEYQTSHSQDSQSVTFYPSSHHQHVQGSQTVTYYPTSQNQHVQDSQQESFSHDSAHRQYKARSAAVYSQYSHASQQHATPQRFQKPPQQKLGRPRQEDKHQ